MGRNFYYYQKRIDERERELTQDLRIRNMLRDLKRKPLTTKNLILRITPTALAIAILMLRNL